MHQELAQGGQVARHQRQAHGEGLEHLERRGVARAEGGSRQVGHDPEVSGRQVQPQAFGSLEAVDAHMGEPRRPRPQALHVVRGAAGDHETQRRKPSRRFHQHLDPLPGHQAPGVDHHGVRKAQVQPAARLVPRRQGAEAPGLQGVVLHADLGRFDAELQQVVAHAARDRDHAQGTARSLQEPAPAQAAAGHPVLLQEERSPARARQQEPHFELPGQHQGPGKTLAQHPRATAREGQLLQARGQELQGHGHAFDPVEHRHALERRPRSPGHAVVVPQVRAKGQRLHVLPVRHEQGGLQSGAGKGGAGLDHLQGLGPLGGHLGVGDQHELGGGHAHLVSFEPA
ncbi:MAG: hypothetical protein IPK67_08805 [Planctomycetes bacterium]|nr:hypothetical protein [Planctomycetota bacterium]